MPLSTAARTSLFVRCPDCGQATQKPVAWLIGKDRLPCDNCPELIDLKAPETRLLIDETVKNCARIDAALAKLR